MIVVIPDDTGVFYPILRPRDDEVLLPSRERASYAR